MIKVTNILGQTKTMPAHAGYAEYVLTFDDQEARVQSEDHARNIDKALAGLRRKHAWLESRGML